ncbi:MAG: hypothetical protein GX285_04315 [Clostridiales bacterium]|nr:hypothetical protein [Clostridiales bacterium]
MKKFLKPIPINNEFFINNHVKMKNMSLTLIKGSSLKKTELYRLVHSSDKSVPPISDFNPNEYLALCCKNHIIAAIKYTENSNVFKIESIAVHPMYPENSVAEACHLMLSGVLGRLPSEK